MRGFTTRVAAGIAAGLLLASPASSQAAAAATCLDGQGAVDRRMEQDGFWLSGYRASLGWTGVATPPGTEPSMGMRALGLVAPEADARLAEQVPGFWAGQSAQTGGAC